MFSSALGYTLSDRTLRHKLRSEECDHLENRAYSVLFIHRLVENEHSEELLKLSKEHNI